MVRVAYRIWGPNPKKLFDLCFLSPMPTPCKPSKSFDKLSHFTPLPNLGLVDENPSTTSGVANIMKFFQKWIPRRPDGTQKDIVVTADGGGLV